MSEKYSIDTKTHGLRRWVLVVFSIAVFTFSFTTECSGCSDDEMKSLLSRCDRVERLTVEVLKEIKTSKDVSRLLPELERLGKENESLRKDIARRAESDVSKKATWRQFEDSRQDAGFETEYRRLARIGLLEQVADLYLIRRFDDACRTLTRTQLEFVRAQIATFEAARGRYPESLRELEKSRVSVISDVTYLSETYLKDAWGRDLIFERKVGNDGRTVKPAVYSPGPMHGRGGQVR